jgi:CTP synthase
VSKYIFVTGGVVSSVGKGTTTASLGRLLKERGLRVALLKIDPYINVDAGLMNPFQHGEVFVTDDGSETDLDLGHYERFVDESLTACSNVTTGQVYGEVIRKERDGGHYLGQTVQVIPHITDEIKERIRLCGREHDADVTITEIGGTVGDIEGQPFLEAIRQMHIDEGDENSCYIHVTLVPHLSTVAEMKTKPTQHSVRELRGVGIQPDIIVSRSGRPLSSENRRKIALFCNVPETHIVESVDCESLYEIPLALEEQQLSDLVTQALRIEAPPPDLSDWAHIVERAKSPSRPLTVAMVGKYMDVRDAYISVTESLVHAGIAHDAGVDITYVDSEAIEEQGAAVCLGDVAGIVVPGGFGDRGIEGKIEAIGHARREGLPFLGLCLGLQCAVIEFARHACGLERAHSKEFAEDTPHPVIVRLTEQEYITQLGGTMRLGAYPCRIVPGSRAAELYQAEEVDERHRHRFEVSNAYREDLEKAGMRLSGTSPEGDLVEMIELPDHPFFMASQFHPEFRSRPNRAHPLFAGFVGACLERAAAAE